MSDKNSVSIQKNDDFVIIIFLIKANGPAFDLAMRFLKIRKTVRFYDC